jgi:plasmid stabilization system protein ParE
MPLEIVFHPKVASDVHQIMAYYEEVSGRKLADDFYAEFLEYVKKAAQNPHYYNVRANGLKRINFERFPHHLLCKIVDNRLRVLIVRHHSRQPTYGMKRL